MTRRRSVPFRALLALLSCAALCAQASAQPNLEELMTAFDAAYELPRSLTTARAALSRRERQLEHALLPALSLRQRAGYADFQHLTVDLDLDVVIPLFRASSEPEAKVLRSRIAGHQAEERWNAMESRMNFQRDVLSTALLREVVLEAGAVLDRLRAESLLPKFEPSELLRLTPYQRDLLALELAVGELQRFAINHLAELEERLHAALAVPGPLELPSFRSLLDGIGYKVPSEAACLAAAPDRLQAEQQYEEQVLAARLVRVLPVQVDLHASGSRGFGSDSGSGYGNGRVSIALQARVPLPDGWPVGGGIDLSAGNAGINQQLQLTWPAPIDLSPTTVGSDSDALQRMADELDVLGAKLRAQRNSLTQARRDVDASELQLLWLARDTYGARADDLTTVRELAAGPFPDVVSDLQATQLRSQLRFALLSEAEQMLELRLTCGGI